MNEWLPWIGIWIGIAVGGLIVAGIYAFGERKGWWW